MKKILLSVVLGVTAVAVAQTPAQPAPGQSATPAAQGQPAAPAAAPQAAAPVIKDPAEYNAYVAAIQQKDANAKISGLEAFLTQYPNSVMKNQALEVLLGTYQQAGNVKKAMETATKLVAAEPCYVPALFLLTYVNRVTAQSGDPNGKQESADAEKYGQQGLDCLSKYQKPEGTSDADFQNQIKTMKEIFDAGIGWGALQDKDYAKAATELKDAEEANAPDSQKDLSLLYPLALSYLQQNPPDYQNGIWFAARLPRWFLLLPSQARLRSMRESQYVKFHAGDDGWADVLAAAKANGAQVPIKPAPTPAEQAACHAGIQEAAEDRLRGVGVCSTQWIARQIRIRCGTPSRTRCEDERHGHQHDSATDS